MHLGTFLDLPSIFFLEIGIRFDGKDTSVSLRVGLELSPLNLQSGWQLEAILASEGVADQVGW